MTTRFTSVDDVLQDAQGLEYFRQWVERNSNANKNAILLYFAIKGYKEGLGRNDRHMASVATQAHKKFISLHTGQCTFLPEDARREMSRRIHSIQHTSLDEQLFDPVVEPLMETLRAYFDEFIQSEEFEKLINQCDGDVSRNSSEEQFVFSYVPVADAQSEGSSRKQRHYKRHTSQPSTSRFSDESSIRSQPRKETIRVDEENSTFRHNRPEDRQVFANALAEKLQELVQLEEQPKKLSSKEKSFRHYLSNSDEEIEKYAGRMELERKQKHKEPEPYKYPQPPAMPSFPNPYGIGGFAPPPIGYDFNVSIPSTFSSSNKTRNSTMHDSSGFNSSESAYFSERSYEHRIDGFRNDNMPMFTSHTLMRQHRTPTSRPQNAFSTLPRRSTTSTDSIRCSLKREENPGPYVANIQSRNFEVSLAQFRKAFAISRKENVRFFFKSRCESEEETAPFQWSVIDQDDDILPLFNGQIIAEARSYVDSD